MDCGSVVAVRIVRDPVTGVGRGFGYVLFEVWETYVLSLSFEMRQEGSSPPFHHSDMTVTATFKLYLKKTKLMTQRDRDLCLSRCSSSLFLHTSVIK